MTKEYPAMLDFRIETFLCVCKYMNFTKASTALNITQPAVMCSCSTAREKLRKLATAKKHSSWVVFMGKPPEFRPFCGITIQLNYKRAL